MLNLDLIDNLYAGLTKEQQQDLISLLFKKSKQTMSYFRRTKDIGMDSQYNRQTHVTSCRKGTNFNYRERQMEDVVLKY